MAEAECSFTVINDYHDYDEDEAQAEDEINADDYVQAVLSRSTPEVQARVHMEERAKYLLHQAELIERSKNEGRCHLQMFRDAARNSDITEAIPPQLLLIPSRPRVEMPKETEDKSKETSLRSSRRSSVTSFSSAASSQKSGIVDAAEGAGDYSSHRRFRWIEEENQRLRETIEQFCTSALTIQTNADLKIMKLEFEIAHLRQKLADEAANNAKVNMANESLRKQLTLAASDIVLTKNGTTEEKKRYSDFMHMHHRELILEKNTNGLITSRHKALKENTALKKLLLGTCYGCRQMLPPGLKRTLDAMSTPVDDGCQPITTAPVDYDYQLLTISNSKSSDSIEKKLSFDTQPDVVLPPLQASEGPPIEESLTLDAVETPSAAATQKAVDSLLEESAGQPIRPPFGVPNYASQQSSRSMTSSKSGRKMEISRRGSARVLGKESKDCFPPQFSSATLTHSTPQPIGSKHDHLEKSMSEKLRAGDGGVTRESPTSTTALLAEDVNMKLPNHHSTSVLNDYSPPQPPTHRDFLRRELSVTSGKSNGSDSQRAMKSRTSPRLSQTEGPSKALTKDKKSKWKSLVFQVPGE